MTIDAAMLEDLLAFVRERQAIADRKAAGAAPPWTADPILARFRFCNLRRTDDVLSRWIVAYVIEPYADNPDLWFILAEARLTNSPKAICALIETPGALPVDGRLDTGAIVAALAAADPWIRPAYRVPTPPIAWIKAHGGGAGSKNRYLADLLGRVWARRDEIHDLLKSAPTVEGVLRLLESVPGVGSFYAMQIATDMTYSSLLAAAPDLNTAARCGPGTSRGISRLHGWPLNADLDQRIAVPKTRELLPILRDAMPALELSLADTCNSLCEWDKYQRVASGEEHNLRPYRPQPPFPTPRHPHLAPPAAATSA